MTRAQFDKANPLFKELEERQEVLSRLREYYQHPESRIQLTSGTPYSTHTIATRGMKWTKLGAQLMNIILKDVEDKIETLEIKIAKI